MFKIRCWFNIAIRRTLVFLNSTLIISHKYGIKVINPSGIDLNNQVENQDYYPIPIKDLRFSIDNLIDESTLLHSKVIDTPHYDLMLRLIENKSISECDYVQRAKEGRLDGRLAMNTKISHYRKVFNDRINQVEKEQIKPISVFVSNQTKYIIDGKHRVALASALGKKTILAQVVERDFKKAQFFKVRAKMKKAKNKNFELHEQFYDKLLNDED